MFEIRVPHTTSETRIPRAPQQPETRRVFQLPREPRPVRNAGRR
jgi:hypothetical protein